MRIQRAKGRSHTAIGALEISKWSVRKMYIHRAKGPMVSRYAILRTRELKSLNRIVILQSVTDVHFGL